MGLNLKTYSIGEKLQRNVKNDERQF